MYRLDVPDGSVNLMDQVSLTKDAVLAASPADPVIVAGRFGLDLIDQVTGNTLKKLPDTRRVSDLSFSGNGMRLAIAYNDKSLEIRDTKTWQPVQTLQRENTDDFAYYMATLLSHDGNLLVAKPFCRTVGPLSSLIDIWDVPASKMYQLVIPGLYRMGLSPDGKTLVIAMHDGYLHFVDPRTGQVKQPLP
jgi:WD40 repeat protein